MFLAGVSKDSFRTEEEPTSTCEVFFGSAKDHGREDFNDHATGLSIQGCAIRGACSVIRLQCEEL